MSLTRRRFTQILASTLFLHHLPSFAQSVKFWASRTLPEAQNITRIVSAGAPADLLLLAVAPEKMVGFSSFDFARQALIPLPEHIRQFPRLGRLAGRASTLSLEGLWRYIPIWSLIAAIRMKPGSPRHGRLANRHKYPGYCLTGNWNNQQNS